MLGDYQSPAGTNMKASTIQRSRNIKVSTHVYHEASPLFNDCKVNLLLFSNPNKKSLDSLYAQELRETDNKALNSILYLSSNALEQCHQPGFMSAELAKKQGLYITSLKPMILNRQIRCCYEPFDRTKPIDHIVLVKTDSSMIPGRLPSKQCRVDIDKPDKLRVDCRKALKRIGAEHAVIFGLEQGDNEVWHFHALVQGYLKPHRVAWERTGWGYIKIDGDRKEYIEINDSATQHLTGFHATAKYCLSKYHPHKKAYLKV